MADFNFEQQPFAKYRVPAMQSLCGMHANGSRPTSIELAAKDLEIMLAERPERVIAWLSTVLNLLAHDQ